MEDVGDWGPLRGLAVSALVPVPVMGVSSPTGASARRSPMRMSSSIALLDHPMQSVQLGVDRRQPLGRLLARTIEAPEALLNLLEGVARPVKPIGQVV